MFGVFFFSFKSRLKMFIKSQIYSMRSARYPLSRVPIFPGNLFRLVYRLYCLQYLAQELFLFIYRSVVAFILKTNCPRFWTDISSWLNKIWKGEAEKYISRQWVSQKKKNVQKGTRRWTVYWYKCMQYDSVCLFVRNREMSSFISHFFIFKTKI